MTRLKTIAVGLTVLLSATLLGAGETSPPSTRVRVAGEVRFKKSAPIFLRLWTLDATGKEVLAREQVIELKPEDLTRRRVPFDFADLAPGRYALKCFQDTNGNRKIDIGMFGPKEPWCTYRFARPKFRAPRFEELAFDVAKDVTDIPLEMQ
jgi:uncharacterized protein (DUF2141 family)